MFGRSQREREFERERREWAAERRMLLDHIMRLSNREPLMHAWDVPNQPITLTADLPVYLQGEDDSVADADQLPL